MGGRWKKSSRRYTGVAPGRQPVGDVSPEEYPMHGDANFWKQGILDSLSPERESPQEWTEAFKASPFAKDEAAFNGLFSERGNTLSGPDAVRLAKIYQETVLRKYGYEGPIDGKLGPLSLAAEQRRRSELGAATRPPEAIVRDPDRGSEERRDITKDPYALDAEIEARTLREQQQGRPARSDTDPFEIDAAITSRAPTERREPPAKAGERIVAVDLSRVGP